jgi:hypothetical protein
MPENDLNTDQPVTDPDLNSAGAVNQQDLQAQSVDEQNQNVLADGSDPNKPVPYAKLKTAIEAKNVEADARKQAEEKAAYAQRQLELMQAQMTGQQNAPQQNAPRTSMEQAMQDCGATADDLYGEVIVKVMARKDVIDRAMSQQQNVAFANQQFVSTHSDVLQVVGSVNPSTGQVMTPSPELAAIILQKPHLAGACTSVQAMYDIVMQERKLSELEKNHAALQQHQTRQGVDTATQPLGGSAAGGGGSGEQTQGQDLMTRAQVDDIERRLAAGEIQ